jgi:hypothetical protein
VDGDDGGMFGAGDRVELYPTIPSETGGSIAAGSIGVVHTVDADASGAAIYLVDFHDHRGAPAERVWLDAQDLMPTDREPPPMAGSTRR